MCSVNIHDVCSNLHFTIPEHCDPLHSHDDPLSFSSEGHADPIYHPAVGNPDDGHNNAQILTKSAFHKPLTDRIRERLNLHKHNEKNGKNVDQIQIC